MKTKFDPTKPVQTRDGRKARIICTDRKGLKGYPILALVTNDNSTENAYSYTADGAYYERPSIDEADLINVPVKHTKTYWLVHWKVGGATPYCCQKLSLAWETKERALAITGPHTDTFVEGQGL